MDEPLGQTKNENLTDNWQQNKTDITMNNKNIGETVTKKSFAVRE